MRQCLPPGVELIRTAKSDRTDGSFDKSHLKTEYKIKLFHAVSRMSSDIASRLQWFAKTYRIFDVINFPYFL